MKSRRLMTKFLLSILALCLHFSASAQTINGPSIAESAVDPAAVAVVAVAEQLFPEVFKNPSGWMDQDGQVYKHYSASGVFLTFGEGNVYLVGGQFGPNHITVGTVTEVLTALQSSVGWGTQTTPGHVVSLANISSSAATVISLAQQVFPDIFASASASDWRFYAGYLYKYFANSGIHVGFKSDKLYLKGGNFGTEFTELGSVADTLIALQGSAGAPTRYFQNVASAHTINALISYFRKITVAYGSISSLGTVNSAVALEVLGQESLSGTATHKLQVTVTGGTLTSPYVALMWVDGSNTVLKVSVGGFEYPANLSNAIGQGLVSGMLLALAAMDQPLVKAAVNNELANYGALQQRVQNKTISGIPVKALTLEISAGSSSVTSELSDFGSFSMATSMRSVVAGMTTSFEMKDLVLR